MQWKMICLATRTSRIASSSRRNRRGQKQTTRIYRYEVGCGRHAEPAGKPGTNGECRPYYEKLLERRGIEGAYHGLLLHMLGMANWLVIAQRSKQRSLLAGELPNSCNNWGPCEEHDLLGSGRHCERYGQLIWSFQTEPSLVVGGNMLPSTKTGVTSSVNAD